MTSLATARATQPPTGTRLDRAFFARSPVALAQDLLGCVLVSRTPEGETRGRIVETEAYFGEDDPASHAARLKRGRVLAMWGEPGIAYVYRSYGMHAMLNAVCEPPGVAAAVLIRALEPLAGIALMEERRGTRDLRQLCSGPGKLCQAMGITLADNGLDLVTSDHLWIETGPRPDAIHASGRIGVSRGAEAALRFFVAGSPFVSAHRRGKTAPSLPAAYNEA